MAPLSPSAILFVQTAASFALQLVVFCAIPFLVFVVLKRSVRGFPGWVGLHAVPPRVVLLAAAIGATFTAIQVPLMWSFLAEPGTVTGNLLAHSRDHGLSGWLLGTVLVIAWLKTALTEEIFFRGFLGARLIAWLGFRWGNLVQAAIFGAVHVAFVAVLPPEQRTMSLAAMLLFAPAIAGWCMGYLNHRLAGGSILPSWTMHGVGNTIAYLCPIVLA